MDAAPPTIDVPAEDAPFVIHPPAPVSAEIIEAAGTPALEVVEDEAREAALIDVLSHDPGVGTMPEIETRLRTMCRLAEQQRLVEGRGELDYLHTALAAVGAAHVSELRRTGLVDLATLVRAEIEARFAERISGYREDEEGQL